MSDQKSARSGNHYFIFPFLNERIQGWLCRKTPGLNRGQGSWAGISLPFQRLEKEGMGGSFSVGWAGTLLSSNQQGQSRRIPTRHLAKTWPRYILPGWSRKRMCSPDSRTCSCDSQLSSRVNGKSVQTFSWGIRGVKRTDPALTASDEKQAVACKPLVDRCY